MAPPLSLSQTRVGTSAVISDGSGEGPTPSHTSDAVASPSAADTATVAPSPVVDAVLRDITKRLTNIETLCAATPEPLAVELSEAAHVKQRAANGCSAESKHGGGTDSSCSAARPAVSANARVGMSGASQATQDPRPPQPRMHLPDSPITALVAAAPQLLPSHHEQHLQQRADGRGSAANGGPPAAVLPLVSVIQQHGNSIRQVRTLACTSS